MLSGDRPNPSLAREANMIAMTEERWVTLREAQAEAGVSLSALRKWYRSGVIRSQDKEGVHGPHKLVAIDDVHRRINAYREATSPSVVPLVVVPPPSSNDGNGDNHGQMLVPREAWQQVMDQLGHIHQAGRELAEAREEKAKAEVTVDFLRPQLEDLRSALEAKDRALNAEVAEHRRVAAEVRGVLAETLKTQEALTPRRWFRRRHDS